MRCFVENKVTMTCNLGARAEKINDDLIYYVCSQRVELSVHEQLTCTTHHSQVLGVGERCTAAHDKPRALVQLLGPNKWLIAAGEQVPAIVFANGPAFVTD
jgi:hypothetical protein